jgi:NAD(P)-dependent dehydrogenase (short-subunit alcohol dehydrogenase family)
VATGRRVEAVRAAVGEHGDDLLVAALDVTQPDQVAAAVQTTLDRFGRIDVLVNNAGYGHLGVFEQTTAEEIRAQYDTNVFGLMNVTRVIAPLMRTQRGGRIFNISSVGGLKGVFGGSIYNSSKFAVEGFSQSIAEELAPFGVHVTTVAPGFFRTDFLDPSSASYTENAIPDYEAPLQAFLDFHHDRNRTQAGDPAKLGEVLVHLAEVADPPVSFVAGSDAVDWALSAAADRQSSVEQWRDLSVSTDGTWSDR